MPRAEVKASRCTVKAFDLNGHGPVAAKAICQSHGVAAAGGAWACSDPEACFPGGKRRIVSHGCCTRVAGRALCHRRRTRAASSARCRTCAAPELQGAHCVAQAPHQSRKRCTVPHTGAQHESRKQRTVPHTEALRRGCKGGVGSQSTFWLETSAWALCLHRCRSWEPASTSTKDIIYMP